MRSVMIGLMLFGAAAAQAPAPTLRAFLETRAYDQLAARRQRLENIRTRAQFEAFRAEVRAKFLRILGGLPAERTPLNARVTGRLERGDYRVEKVLFESLPRFYVTGNLYIPQRGQPPYPAVLQPVGHSLTGKNRAFYQMISIGLAKQGFVVLTYDPIGQGERRIFYDPDLGDSKVGSATAEHSMVGQQSLLAGESVARYRIWDGLRGIDYLLSRSEVDSKRIGVTGCSGGGTLTTYIAALDERIQAAAPSCYISSWEEQLKGTGPQDAEQQFPDQLLEGVGHAELILLAAPKPYLICSSTEDFFPLAGAKQTFEEVKRIYALHGAEEKIGWFTEPGPHGVRQPGREAIYSFMKRWLAGEPGAGAVTEPRLATEHEDDLNVTETGQVSTSLGGETASTLNMKRLAAVATPRPPLADSADIERLRARLRNDITRLARYTAGAAPLGLRSLERRQRGSVTIEALTYDPEAGRSVAALLLEPAGGARRGTVVYVDQGGVAPGGAETQDAVELAELGYAVLALDPVGVGPSIATWDGRPGRSLDFKTVWLALMVGKPIPGLRLSDILRGLDVLAERKLLPAGGVTGFGKGLVGLDLVQAAVLDGRFTGLVLEGALLSYRAVADKPIHRNVFEIILPGVLANYDVPDLIAALAPRPVTVANPRSPTGEPVLPAKARAAYEYIFRAYGVAGAPDGFRLLRRRESEPIAEAYPQLR